MSRPQEGASINQIRSGERSLESGPDSYLSPAGGLIRSGIIGGFWRKEKMDLCAVAGG